MCERKGGGGRAANMGVGFVWSSARRDALSLGMAVPTFICGVGHPGVVAKGTGSKHLLGVMVQGGGQRWLCQLGKDDAWHHSVKLHMCRCLWGERLVTMGGRGGGRQRGCGGRGIKGSCDARSGHLPADALRFSKAVFTLCAL